MPNGTYGGVRGRKTKVGRKLLRFPPTRFGLTPNGGAVDYSICFEKPKWLLCLQINNINKRKSCSP